MLDELIAGIQEKIVLLSLISDTKVNRSSFDYYISIDDDVVIRFTYHHRSSFTKRYETNFFSTLRKPRIYSSYVYMTEDEALEQALELLDELIKEVKQ